MTSRASEIHRTLMSVLLDCGPAIIFPGFSEDRSNKSAKTKAKLEQEGCERTFSISLTIITSSQTTNTGDRKPWNTFETATTCQ